MLTPEQNEKISNILRDIEHKVSIDQPLSIFENEAWKIRTKRGVFYAVKENEELFLKLVTISDCKITVNETDYLKNAMGGHQYGTTIEKDGLKYRVSTFRRHSGRLSSCYVPILKENKEDKTMLLHYNKTVWMIQTDKRATRKACLEQHEQAVRKYIDQLITKNK